MKREIKLRAKTNTKLKSKQIQENILFLILFKKLHNLKPKATRNHTPRDLSNIWPYCSSFFQAFSQASLLDQLEKFFRLSYFCARSCLSAARVATKNTHLVTISTKTSQSQFIKHFNCIKRFCLSTYHLKFQTYKQVNNI